MLNERVLAQMLDDVVTEALSKAEGLKYIQLVGDTYQELSENADHAEAIIVRRLIQFLVANQLVTLRPPQVTTGHLADERLRDPLRSGFEEGRSAQNYIAQAQASDMVKGDGVHDSVVFTDPETYEQLQLPGMED